METWNKDKPGVPIRVWASRVDKESRKRLERLARNPVLAGPLAVMPDVHASGKICVGTVLVTEHQIIRGAVGDDLGCGMAVRKLSIEASRFSREDLEKLLRELAAVIPVGRKSHSRPQDVPGRLFERELSSHYLEHERQFLAPRHIGTLGGGNHFVELQRDGSGALWVSIHSGSRGMGPVLVSFHTKNATSEEAVWNDYGWAFAFAEANRAVMQDQVLAVLSTFTGEKIEVLDGFDVPHNVITREKHAGKSLIVHRKGAMGLKPGERGLIPGSMGTASYIVEGLGCGTAYGSCSHGAGRLLTRTEARAQISLERLRREMGGVVYPAGLKRELCEEAPSAYKPIKEVLSEQEELARPLLQLRPVAVLKG